MSRKKVAVIGAGAAGLMAAVSALRQGCEVTVFEKNEKAGKKIYITGKGRCNLTNACDHETFLGQVVSNPKFLYSALNGFDSAAVIDFMEKSGCPVKIERGRRAFPVSDHASDVTAALVRQIRAMGGRILYRTEVKKILARDLDPVPEEGRTGKKKLRQTRQVTGLETGDGKTYRADAVILCTGGLSYPSTGSDGAGHAMALSLGHSLKKAVPSLVPLTCRETWPMDLQGLALKNVEVSFYPLSEAGEVIKKKKPLFRDFGEMLFTHFGISGPIILTASCHLDFEKYPGGFRMDLDLKPAIPGEELEDRMKREFQAVPFKHLSVALRSFFPARLAETVADLSGLGPDTPVRSLTEGQIHELAGLVRAIPLTITGTRGFAEAIVTRGGIKVGEVNPSTMESRLVRGLFLAGELLDLDAHTGGYNLQIAWSTGHLAGECAGKEE